MSTTLDCENIDVFTVTLPFSIPNSGPLIVNEFELPIIALQDHIIDDLRFKLAQKTARADEALRQKYQAVVEERTEILASRDRAIAETEVMRKKRNEAEANLEPLRELVAKLQDENKKLVDSKAHLERELRHARTEIEGFPKVLENKIRTALSQAGADSDELRAANERIAELELDLSCLDSKRSDTAAKNSALNEQVKLLTKECGEHKQHVQMLTELTGMQQEQIGCMEEGMRNADRNYHSVMHHLDELMGYTAIICAENDELRKDNLYLSQAVEYHDLKVVWKNDSWQAFMLCKSSAVRPQPGMPEPHSDFGLLYLMDTTTGRGHTAYLDKELKVCFSKLVDPTQALPAEFHADFEAAASQLPVAEIETALYRAAERTKKVIQYANHFYLTWNSNVSFVEIAQRLHDYVPQRELTRALENIERAKLLAPRSQALLERINKRFDSEYALHNKGGRVPASRDKTGAVIGKPKRKRSKKNKRK